MKLKRPVTVKAIVTEELKSTLKEELNMTIARVDQEIGQIEMQLKRYVPEVAKADLEQASRLRRELEGERQRREGMKAEISAKMQEIQGLEMGSEFVQGQIEGEVEVKVGDNLMELLSGAEILVKDGVVQEIKEG